MEYQVIFKDDEQRDVATPMMCAQDKDAYIEMLQKSEIKYVILEKPDRKVQLAKVVFNMQLIPSAREAIKQEKDLYGMYTFEDPRRLAEENNIIKVECTTGEIRIAYVVGLWHATTEEVEVFKTKIGYRKLGQIVEKI